MSAVIESIEILHYRLPLDPPFAASWDTQPRQSHTSTLVRVRAGAHEGVGSGEAMLGFHGHEPLFVGRDPFDIERHVRILDNLQFHYGRMWPLEVALWDLMGKIKGQPLWEMLGGQNGQVRVYASTGERLRVKARTESVGAIKAAGFSALKLRFNAPDPRQDLPLVRAVRELVGDSMEILVDANQGWRMPWDDSPSWDLKRARWAADALAELDVYWLEEPLARHDYGGLSELRRRSRVRIAGGEGNREFAELLEYHRLDCLDVYQPDVVWSTGVLRARTLADQVQADGALYSPHTWGDGLVLLANLHVAAALSRAPFVDYPFDPPTWTPERRDFVLPKPIRPDSMGMITLPNKPGLGVELDWSMLERLRVQTGTMEAS